MYPKIKFIAENWSDLCNFYSKVISWNVCSRKYFFYFSLLNLNYWRSIGRAELWAALYYLLVFHNNIMKNSEKNEQAELVENLPPNYLPYKFLLNLHSFLLLEKVKIFDLLKSLTRIKHFVHW